jgi:hypothetical protein
MGAEETDSIQVDETERLRPDVPRVPLSMLGTVEFPCPSGAQREWFSANDYGHPFDPMRPVHADHRITSLVEVLNPEETRHFTEYAQVMGLPLPKDPESHALSAWDKESRDWFRNPRAFDPATKQPLNANNQFRGYPAETVRAVVGYTVDSLVKSFGPTPPADGLFVSLKLGCRGFDGINLGTSVTDFAQFGQWLQAKLVELSHEKSLKPIFLDDKYQSRLVLSANDKPLRNDDSLLPALATYRNTRVAGLRGMKGFVNHEA